MKMLRDNSEDLTYRVKSLNEPAFGGIQTNVFGLVTIQRVVTFLKQPIVLVHDPNHFPNCCMTSFFSLHADAGLSN